MHEFVSDESKEIKGDFHVRGNPCERVGIRVAIRDNKPDDVDVVAKQFVLKLHTAQIFRGQCRSDAEQARVIQKRSPSIGMLVFLDKLSPEADGVLGSLRVEVPRVGDGSKKSGRCNYLPLAFGDLGATFLEIRNSRGVWAKNSARNITG